MSSLTEAELDTATPSELLCLAAQRGRTDLTISALRSGALVNVLTPDRVAGSSSTALHIALALGHVDVARALLSAGASLTALDSSGRTAVQVAAPSAQVSAALAAHVCQLAASGDTVRLQDAIDAQLDLERADAHEQGNTPLHWAAAFGQVEAVEILLEAGVDPDPPNARGDTPLRDAAAADHVSVARTLVAAGADPFKLNKAGSSPVDVAPNGEVLGVLQGDSKPLLQSRVVREEKSEVLMNGERGGTVYSPATSPHPPGNNVSSRSAGVGDSIPTWATLLWPRPQRFVEAAGPGFTVPPVFTVSAENNCMPVARMLLSWLRASRSLPEDEYTLRLVGGGQGGLGESIAFSASVFLRIDSCALEKADQAYSLTAKYFGIDVVGSDLCGLFYGCCSLLNVFKLKRSQASDTFDPLSIPAFSITDWPCIRRRGLYLDISGRRLPKQETLRRLVEYMATAMKMNQLQINIGSNFQQLESNVEEAAFRHEHILELNEICRKHFVELIPVVDENGPPRKAENVDELRNEKGGGGFESGSTENKSAAGLEKLYDEFLPLFDSPQVSVGCLSRHVICELSDLERLREAAKSMRSRGKSNVLTFSNSIAEVLADHVNAAGLLAELPARSIFIVEAAHPDVGELDMRCRQLSKCGVSFYTCSSSCLDSSISGCYQNFMQCSSAAIEVAVNQGASGVLLKDKISSSQGAPMVFLFLSLVPFAGTLWNPKQGIVANLGSPENSLSRLYNTYVFQDPADKGMLGKIAGSLGDFHAAASIESETALSDILSRTSSEVRSVVEETGYLSLRRAMKKADKIESALLSYDGNADPADVQELRACAILMSVAARLGASLLTMSSATSMDSAQCLAEDVSDICSLPDGRRSDLCNALLEAIDLLRDTWMLRYHENGFPQMIDSVAGKTLSKLADRMPYQDYVEERKANGWAPINQ